MKANRACAVEAVGPQGDGHSPAAVGQLGSLWPLGSWAVPWHRGSRGSTTLQGKHGRRGAAEALTPVAEGNSFLHP